MEMIVPDEIRDVLDRLEIDRDLRRRAWAIIDPYIPDNHATLRRNRPADWEDR